LLYFWISGVAILFAIEAYLYRRLVQNLAPGIRREEVFYGIPGRGGRFAASIDSELFNEIGKKYRLLAIWNETIYAIWIFVVGPILIIMSRQ
jgi:hypothetical protein